MHVKIIKDCITIQIHPPRTIGFESEVPAPLFLIPYSFPVYTVHTHWKRMRSYETDGIYILLFVVLFTLNTLLKDDCILETVDFSQL